MRTVTSRYYNSYDDFAIKTPTAVHSAHKGPIWSVLCCDQDESLTHALYLGGLTYYSPASWPGVGVGDARMAKNEERKALSFVRLHRSFILQPHGTGKERKIDTVRHRYGYYSLSTVISGIWAHPALRITLQYRIRVVPLIQAAWRALSSVL
jgi:hypothetical protein